VPRFSCVDAHGVSRLIHEWLTRPTLRSATLVSFTFDPDFKWAFRDAMTDRLVGAMHRAAGIAELTVVVATNVVRESSVAGQRRRRALSQLSIAGATVLLHDTLHAKVYLFEEEGRCCWVVGSSNMTTGGLGKNSEVSLRGFHDSDFGAVHKSVLQLIGDSQPYKIEEETDD
jgi:phosphatidylserine/phosphatidylglycerophosphate/cardiolipin synthase-like enzyme